MSSGDRDAVAHAQSRALELATGLALPATLGLIVLAQPIVRLLFEHGAFGADDSVATAHALMWLALGLPAQVLIKALSPAFYARGDTWTPLLATVTGFVIAIALAVLLGHVFGAGGIAAGIAAGAWSSALTLIRKGTSAFGFAIEPAARRRLPRILLAAAAMGGLLWLTAGLIPAETHGVVAWIMLGLQIAAGIAVYGALLHVLGAASWREARAALRRPT